MNDIEVKRLAHAVNELRPGWPISSLTTFISRSLSNRPYKDAAIALVWIALDMDGAGNYVSETPKRVLELGPWWKAAEHTGSLDGHRYAPPKAEESCRICNRHLDACICGERATRPSQPATDPGKYAAACRAALKEGA